MDNGVPASPSGCEASPSAAVPASSQSRIPNAERPWMPHERNYSGGRVGCWQTEDWTMLRVEAGMADATISIREHEAWDLALRLSPALKSRLDELFAGRRKAEAAVYQFKHMSSLAPLLRKVAAEWDCGDRCRYASSDCGALSCPKMEDVDGCQAVEAHELLEFAVALETASAMEAAAAGETANAGSTEGESAVPQADAEPQSGEPFDDR